MLFGGPFPSFDVPIFDCANNVTLVGGAKHYLDFIHDVGFQIGQQQVKSPTRILLDFAGYALQVS
jgi:hypothetical protein